ncbi:MAG: tetratricopeptide repeat protein, partial [Desulfosudaceae bacterium]
YFQLKDFTPARSDALVLFYAIKNYLYAGGSARLWLDVPPDSAFWPIIPLAYLILVLKITGLNLSFLHLSNLFIHILCALTLYAVLRKATRDRWRGAFAAALFAVHPLNVEIVASLHLCVYTISTLFGLIALRIYVASPLSPGPKHFLAIFIAWSISLLSHPAVIVLPVLFLIFDFWMQSAIHPGESPVSPTGWRTRIIAKWPFFGFGLLWVIFYLGFVFAVTPSAPIINPAAYLERLPLALVSWARYLEVIVLPFRLPGEDVGASLFTGPYPWSAIALSGLVLAALTGAVLLSGKRYRSLPAGWLWFLICLIPFITLHLNKENIFDRRYAYLPAIGIYIMISWGGAALVSRLKHKNIIAAALIAVILISLTTSARQQARHWKNIETYINFSTAGESGVAKSRVYFNYGRLLLSQGDLSQATETLNRALAVNKRSPEIHNALGLALAANRNTRPARVHFERALALNPEYIEARHNLANLLADTGHPEKAIAHYRKTLKLDSSRHTTHNNLATALMETGDYDRALDHLEKALALNPEYHTARKNLRRLRTLIKKDRPAGDHQNQDSPPD